MNNIKLKDKLRNISKEKNVDFNTLLRLYMYDRFIERLSISKYKYNFILKGGFYLSTLYGVENRTTMDIDTAFRNANFNEEMIVKMIKEILSIRIDDNAKLSYLGIQQIRNEDKYGGFRIDIEVRLENIKEKFHIDIATGDPITPKPILYKYIPLLKDNCINLLAYNIETVLAEKLETIFSRLELNGRMRDFYDIYLVYSQNSNSINKEYLKQAFYRTLKKRNFNGDINKSVGILKNSDILKQRWDIYSKKNKYAKEIKYEEIIFLVEKLIKIIELVNI